MGTGNWVMKQGLNIWVSPVGSLEESGEGEMRGLGECSTGSVHITQKRQMGKGVA